MTGRSVTVIGAGGNIGSHLAPHLARMPGVARVTLVDRDAYEPKNLAGQDIERGDVNRPKALVQARRVRRINPALGVDAIAAAVEHVPLGRLGADVILACLDSRLARQYVIEAAWRPGAPWIDAGVRADGLLARVNVYRPGEPEGACLECAWSDADYAAIEQAYPCQPGRATPAPTDAPSALGALAAAIQALECQKLLARDEGAMAAGRQITLDARWQKHYVTSFRRNPRCRFDHGTWQIETLPRGGAEFTLGQAVALGGAVGIEGMRFAQRLTCTGCGRTRAGLRLLRPPLPVCPKCRSAMTATGFDRLERLDGNLPQRALARSLASLGLRPGDVLDAGEKHYQIPLAEAL